MSVIAYARDVLARVLADLAGLAGNEGSGVGAGRLGTVEAPAFLDEAEDCDAVEIGAVISIGRFLTTNLTSLQLQHLERRSWHACEVMEWVCPARRSGDGGWRMRQGQNVCYEGRVEEDWNLPSQGSTVSGANRLTGNERRWGRYHRLPAWP